jgi:hypothetical protein
VHVTPGRTRVITSRSMLRTLLVTAVAFGMTSPLCGDDRKDEKARAEEFLVVAKREAAAYTIRLLTSDPPLALKPEPILKWSNPVVGSIYGDVFIWTKNGRPEAVASIYRFNTNGHRANEFHSLALDKLIGERDGVAVWTPSRRGLELKPIPGAPVPADSAAVRFRQMRTLAEEFIGRQTTRQRIERDMRLLAQPIYRYENTKGDLIDGGLFVFVQATDPETFLLIEARRTKAGAAEWRFGATRMSVNALRITHRGREIWSAAELPWSQVWDGNEPYCIFRFDFAPGAQSRQTETAKP